MLPAVIGDGFVRGAALSRAGLGLAAGGGALSGVSESSSLSSVDFSVFAAGGFAFTVSEGGLELVPAGALAPGVVDG
jgi:hypothetical protein